MRRVCLILCVCAAALFAADAPWPTYGWTISTPEEQGMNSAQLEQADAWIRDNSPNRYSLLVVRNGRLVFERYYHGANAYTPYHIASISKSFLSALTGIAVEQGSVSLDDRWFDIFPEYAGAVDPRTTDLRVRHMLTMAVGLDWSDSDIIPVWYATPRPDWILHTLTRPIHAAPGERFWYNTGNTHMLSAFLTRKTGLTTYEFARQNLLVPTGIGIGDWWRDFSSAHFYTGGFGMHVTPRDLAKFGYLYLRDGTWEGRQVVPEAWVRESVEPKIRHNTGADDFYGYLWWMDNLRGFFVPSARGMGSQYIWYSRELDLVVVTTGDYTGTSTNPTRIMTDYVIPSLYPAAPAVGAVVNAASNAPVIAPDSFATIYGEHLAPAESQWGSVVLDGKTLPPELGGLKVKIAGKNAWLSYAGPKQVNVLVPADVPAGAAELEVSHPGGTATASITIAAISPGLFGYQAGGRSWASALFAGQGVYVAEPGAFPNAASRPARPGDYLELYGSGLGLTAAPHAPGAVLALPLAHAEPASVEVFFGEAKAEVQAVTMTYAGVWQVNVRVPGETPIGDVPVTLRVKGVSTSPVLLRITR